MQHLSRSSTRHHTAQQRARRRERWADIASEVSAEMPQMPKGRVVRFPPSLLFDQRPNAGLDDRTHPPDPFDVIAVWHVANVMDLVDRGSAGTAEAFRLRPGVGRHGGRVGTLGDGVKARRRHVRVPWGRPGQGPTVATCCVRRTGRRPSSHGRSWVWTGVRVEADVRPSRHADSCPYRPGYRVGGSRSRRAAWVTPRSTASWFTSS